MEKLDLLEIIEDGKGSYKYYKIEDIKGSTLIKDLEELKIKEISYNKFKELEYKHEKYNKTFILKHVYDYIIVINALTEEIYTDLCLKIEKITEIELNNTINKIVAMYTDKANISILVEI